MNDVIDGGENMLFRVSGLLTTGLGDSQLQVSHKQSREQEIRSSLDRISAVVLVKGVLERSEGFLNRSCVLPQECTIVYSHTH